MTAIDAEVIICGAGIGGLTLAAICRQLGISYKVLERTETLQPVGAGISLSPNALRVLDQLGVYEKVLETAQKLRKLQIWRNNTQWNTVSLDNFEPTYGYPIVSAERHNFHRLLYAAAGEDEHVVLNAKVTDVIDVPGEPVRVVVEGGNEYRGHVVVGADGIRSAVRRALLRKNDLNKGNTIQFTGRVHFSGITSPLENCGPSEIGVANWMLYDQAILTTWPCQDNRQWYIGVKKAEGDVDKNRSVWGSITPGDIKKVYGRAFHPFAEGKQFGSIVDKSERVIASNVFQEVEFPSMYDGRVALLGDAAHSMTSFFGQGGCQAIEDAAVLGNLLAENRKTLDKPHELLATYAKIREPRTKDLATFSDSFAMLHTARLPYGMGPFVRWFLYTLVPTWFWISYLGWLYRYQPTVTALGNPPSHGKKRQ
ncbi:FAD binding monooxygenase [Purpureocillium lilacinum]|uniref:FAD binding monooxygenase n=1 Tax=Purpureocillium lilacinum TaxID=33203 RepID=A0A179GSR4_PURLI|nr:FAD binding monooxygenase [Purpureocillium lilacinum]OAQ80967.1 FAD binding monooxygenase [Purpureocillium lilacinum]